MSENTGIEWTDATWNPVTGCNKVSPGCKNCYAERMANRLKTPGRPNTATALRLPCILRPSKFRCAGAGPAPSSSTP